MNTLKINIPEGFKIKQFDEKTGEVSFEPIPKDIKERIQTFPNVLNYHNIIARDFAQQCDELAPDEVAYRKLKLIAQALNEGWTPDWTDSNEYKYYPWFEMGSASGVGFSYDGYDHWYSISCVGSRLCFKSRELAEYAGKQFEDIYKEFLTIKQ
ncbi:hypothetical protein [Yeosuana marina]|uniref:hypothetical protein n=1 Tax=Yeosuana marina TaxID=1565536 RepID=UPI00141DC86C|nr:hypothetical protein [Yeosuana marina]